MRTLEDRGAALSLLAIVLVLIIIIAVVGIALFYPWKVTNIDESRSVDVTPAMNEIDLYVDQSVGKVLIAFSNGDLQAVTMTVKGTVSQNLLASGDPLAITWSPEVSQQRLILSTKVEMAAYASTYGAEEIVTIVTIPNQLAAMVNVTGTVGSIELAASNGSTLRGGHLSEMTGSILARLTDCSLKGSLSIQTTTGSCTLDWLDVTTIELAEVNIDCTTGGVMMELSQSIPLGGNLSLMAKTTVGAADLTLHIEDGNSARVVSTSDSGDINVGALTGFMGGINQDLRSSNYPSQDKMELAIETSVGAVNLNLEYLS
jgi:hypothetical protein